ncbi:hypothetical protein [Leuconostoc pseudomesenteroides]|uniref:hypothetical protein n=1 Tax=Leuconostoc pseudomesenteroides TaxID=33968 RepID=UPI002286969A|nr:hypothetical protein [Leuconostoc pseudomesenteroides]WAM38228.1 hypothetical protein OYT93_08460 [Leuconostoc pseudomesenteroides]
MTEISIHGFNSNAVTATKPRKYTATDYLKTQLIFLKRLRYELDEEMGSNTKIVTMVDMQIVNIESQYHELTGKEWDEV